MSAPESLPTLKRSERWSLEPTGTREHLEILVMRAFARSFERCSFPACRRAGAWMGLAFFSALKRRRRVAVENVRMALGVSEARAQQIARRASQNFSMTFCEFLRERVATPQEILEQCPATGIEYITDGLQEGRGVLLLTAHIGNWELLGARAAQSFPISVISRPTSNLGVQREIDAVRAHVGMDMISKFEPGRAALRALRDDRALAILPDQHAGNEGLLLPFFGRPTRFVPAIARLSVLTGAPVVPAFGFRRSPWLRDGRISGTMLPRIPFDDLHNLPKSEREAAVLEGTRRVIALLEKTIRENPDQWLWMHRRWRDSDLHAPQE